MEFKKRFLDFRLFVIFPLRFAYNVIVCLAGHLSLPAGKRRIYENRIIMSVFRNQTDRPSSSGIRREQLSAGDKGDENADGAAAAWYGDI